MSSDDNIVISPYSIYTSLSSILLAARGKTKYELGRVLHQQSLTALEMSQLLKESSKEKGVRELLKISNLLVINNNTETRSAHIRKNIKKLPFMDVHKWNLAADPLGFEDKINRKVEYRTKGNIKNILPPGTINEQTSAIFVNAIYFKAKWMSPFPKTNTIDKDFFTSNDEVYNVKFLYDEDYFQYGSIPNLNATAVDLKYVDSDFSMVIVLPNRKDGLRDLLNEISKNYTHLMNFPKLLDKKKIEIFIPKFKVEYEIDLEKPLTKLGAETLFTNEADLSNIFSNNKSNIRISKAVHKAVISVDEEGTEASASTCEFLYNFK